MDRIEYLKFFVFIFGFTVFSFSGYLFPYRRNKINENRFFINILFSLINTLAIYMIMSRVSLGRGLTFYEIDYGLMSYLSFPRFLKFILGIIILDLVIYWQHRLFHEVPFLWSIHRVHHSDNEFDTSTGLRFHPLEAIISLLNRLLVIYIFGISLFALVVFEMILNFASMFNHSNFKLPKNIESELKKIIITPDLHRIHHSLDVKDYNSNYGFSVIIWDVLFKTFKEKSRLDFKTSNIGALGFQSDEKQKILSLLMQPLD